jgi:hypothetical protein
MKGGMPVRGPKVTRVIKIGATKIGVVAWWEKRGKKAGCVRLSVWRNGEPAQGIVADCSDAPLQNKNAHQGRLAKIAFTISAEEQARRTADAFIRRLGLALQNALTELYQDFCDASFYLDPRDALTATCWLRNLQRVAEWAKLLDIAQETIAHELLKLAGWSHVIEKEREAGRRLVTVAAARGDEPDYIVDLNFDLGFADYAA